MQYRPEIDGLRSIAVLPVIFFHAGLGLFSGGYVGVDIFFVISGYLITNIIISELDRGTFSIIGFYERRARRILPALSLILIVCLLLAPLGMMPSEFDELSRSIIAVVLFSSNFLFWKTSGYFDIGSEEKPLLHTWSLAVEEQYYLLFPLVLLLVWRFGRRWTLALLIIAALASLGISEWGWRHAPSGNFFLAPSRGWELLAGSLCAIVLLRREPMPNDLLALSGLGAILYAIFAFDEHTPFPSLYALAPVIGTAFIIIFATPGTRMARILSTPALVGIGLISYSAYLWHQPLFATARVVGGLDQSRPFMLALAVLSLVLAWITWKWVESPFRDRNKFERQRIFLLSGASIVVFLFIGAIGIFTNGFERQWLSFQSPSGARTYALLKVAARDHMVDGAGRDAAPCVFNTPTLRTPAVQQRLKSCFERHGSGLAVLGDSHAIDLFGMMTVQRDGRFPFIVGITSGGCRPHDNDPACQYGDFLEMVKRQPNLFRHVIYEQAGFYLLNVDGAPVERRDPLLNRPLSASFEGFSPNRMLIAKVADYLSQIDRVTRVTWFGARFEPQIRADILVERGCDGHFQARSGQQELFATLDRTLAEASRTRGLEYRSQVNEMRFDFEHDFLNCRETYWSDGDHYSRVGEARFSKRGFS